MFKLCERALKSSALMRSPGDGNGKWKKGLSAAGPGTAGAGGGFSGVGGVGAGCGGGTRGNDGTAGPTLIGPARIAIARDSARVGTFSPASGLIRISLA